jgi:outer membrane lipoprotein-sorting protein
MKTDRARRWALTIALTCFCALLVGQNSAWGLITETELKARVEKAAKGLTDLSMVGTVTYKNRKVMERVDPAYVSLYEFKSATVLYKSPDKLRMEGKLGMVKFEYIINGGLKIIRVPNLRINKKESFTDDPAKLQRALDIGLVTPSLWQDRRVTILEDAQAQAAGEIKLRLYWAKGDMIYYAWLDAENLWLKRFEKRDAVGKLIVRVDYSSPQKIGGIIWMPTKTEVFGPDGEKAGASEISDIKVNVGLADSLFE